MFEEEEGKRQHNEVTKCSHNRAAIFYGHVDFWSFALQISKTTIIFLSSNNSNFEVYILLSNSICIQIIVL